MNILGILFGCYLLRNVFPFSADTYMQYYREFSLILAGLLGWFGWENWILSTLAGALYLFLGFTFQGAGNVPEFLAGGVNLVFLIPSLIYFVHVYLLKPKP